jgi:hypothetical protein
MEMIHSSETLVTSYKIHCITVQKTEIGSFTTVKTSDFICRFSGISISSLGIRDLFGPNGSHPSA